MYTTNITIEEEQLIEILTPTVSMDGIESESVAVFSLLLQNLLFTAIRTPPPFFTPSDEKFLSLLYTVYELRKSSSSVISLDSQVSVTEIMSYSRVQMLLLNSQILERRPRTF
jgi:hypothetical protein